MKIRTELARFVVSGALGFLVDTAVLYAALALGCGFYLGRALSFLAAVSFTWIFNRSITFADPEAARQPWLVQWLSYLVAMALGGALNYAVSAWVYANSELVVRFPVLAVAAGSAAGMTLNFATAKFWVFRPSGR